MTRAKKKRKNIYINGSGVGYTLICMHSTEQTTHYTVPTYRMHVPVVRIFYVVVVVAMRTLLSVRTCWIITCQPHSRACFTLCLCISSFLPHFFSILILVPFLLFSSIVSTYASVHFSKMTIPLRCVLIATTKYSALTEAQRMITMCPLSLSISVYLSFSFAYSPDRAHSHTHTHAKTSTTSAAFVYVFVLSWAFWFSKRKKYSTKSNECKKKKHPRAYVLASVRHTRFA